ncbi:MAG: gamma carbonic anhydrase family protein [Candidatus Micrarchaeia archaeon]|jgi:carbonic anhydrase/acetyltransferase-like protein (isoleucine patch superfamily)
MSFIHPQSSLDPKAVLGKNVYIAAFAAIRADEGRVEVGDGTSIQEGCVIHGKNVRIGKNVTVGHGAILHGCIVGDNVLVGMNATVLDGCEIGQWSIIAAGAVVTAGTRVPGGSVVAGVPAKVLRKADGKDRRLISSSCENYLNKLRGMAKFD